MAKELGIPVAELLGRISSRELSEWIVFNKLEREEYEKGRQEKSKVQSPEEMKKQMMLIAESANKPIAKARTRKK